MCSYILYIMICKRNSKRLFTISDVLMIVLYLMYSTRGHIYTAIVR